MSRTWINTLLKLKSGGGVLNDVTNGLSVDSGTTANKIVALDGSAKLPAVDGSQLTNITKLNLIASNNLLFSKDGETSQTGSATVTLNTITPLVGGTIRVKFDAKTSIGSVTYTLFNGGTFSVNNGYQTFTADIVVGPGEKITVSCNPGGNTAYIKNFRIYGILSSSMVYGY